MSNDNKDRIQIQYIGLKSPQLTMVSMGFPWLSLPFFTFPYCLRPFLEGKSGFSTSHCFKEDL